MAANSPRARRSAAGTVLCVAVPLALLAAVCLPQTLLFAFGAPVPPRAPRAQAALCGGALAGREPSSVGASAAATMTATGWLNPARWGGAPQPPSERLSPREWARMYRILGLEMDASKDKVTRAVNKLRKKYSNDDKGLQRVENANVWIVTKILSQEEEVLKKRQQANRLRELGDSPRKLFMKYVAGYLPPSVRQLFEAPTSKHFRTASGLMGFFALLGLCVPTQATNFVSLSGVATMGLIYQRNRPEPVKDEMGNVGRQQKINYKEMGATIAITALSAGLGVGATVGLAYLVDAPWEAIFCLTTCATLWLASLFFKVYGCFDPEE